MSRDGYERWEDRPDGLEPDAYDPRAPRRSRRAASPDEKWPADSGPQDTHNRHGSHRRSDPDAAGGDGASGRGASGYDRGSYGGGAHGGGAYGDAGYGGDSGYGEAGYADSGYGHSGHGDSGHGDRGYARGEYAGSGFAGNGYRDGNAGNGYTGYTGPGQAGYDHPDDYNQGAGFGRTAGYPDAGYPERGYPDSGSAGAGYPGAADADTYAGPAAQDGYRDGGGGAAGYESGYQGFGRDAGSYPDTSYPANGYETGGYGTAAASGRPQARDPYGPKDPYGAPDAYAPDPYPAAEPYEAPDRYGRGGSLGHTDPRGRTDPRGQTDPFTRTDPSRGQTDPFGRTEPHSQAETFGSAERYAPAAGYEDDTLGRSGPPSSTYASEASYGEPGSYGTQDPYGGPAGYDTGDPFAGRDARGQRGVNPAAYAGPAGNVHGGGYDEHDYDAAPGHEPSPAQAAEYARRGDRDESYGWQAPVDDTGVTRRRQREPEDELDADSARHNGFFRGFGAADDEVGHRPPKRRRSRAGMVAMVVIIIFLGGVVGAGAYGYHWYSSRHADWSGSGFGTVIVQVPQGGSAYGLSTVLVKDGVIAAAAPFRSYAEASGKASLLEPGYFRLHKHMSASAAWNLVIDPKARVQIKVGVPDGMRASKVIALLAAKTGIPLSQFQAALKDTSALGLPSYAKGNYEGFLWPATYNIQPGTSALAILQTMVKQFNTEMTSMNLAGAAKAAKLTEYKVIIQASLLEAEVPPQYYTKVARVIDNRLNQVPPWDLGLDSTVAYAVNKYIYNLSQSDLNVKSPYNTTKHPGLPPGPIDSPDLTAIQAVLHPAQGDWLYFVTVNKSGLTRFTTSATQFNAWAALAKQNGI